MKPIPSIQKKFLINPPIDSRSNLKNKPSLLEPVAVRRKTTKKNMEKTITTEQPEPQTKQIESESSSEEEDDEDSEDGESEEESEEETITTTTKKQPLKPNRIAPTKPNITATKQGEKPIVHKKPATAKPVTTTIVPAAKLNKPTESGAKKLVQKSTSPKSLPNKQNKLSSSGDAISKAKLMSSIDELASQLVASTADEPYIPTAKISNDEAYIPTSKPTKPLALKTNKLTNPKTKLNSSGDNIPKTTTKLSNSSDGVPPAKSTTTGPKTISLQAYAAAKPSQGKLPGVKPGEKVISYYITRMCLLTDFSVPKLDFDGRFSDTTTNESCTAAPRRQW